MSAELIGILAVGVALASLMLTALRAVRTDLRREIARETGTVCNELRGEIHAVRDEFRNELRGSMHAMRDELRGDIHAVRGELRGDIQAVRGDTCAVRDDLRADIRGLDERMRTQEHGMARLEGLLEVLREAVLVRSAPWPTASEPQGRREAPG